MNFLILLSASLAGIAAAQSSSTAPTFEIITVTIPDGAGPTPSTGGGSPDGKQNITSTSGWPDGTECSGWDMPNDHYASIKAAKKFLQDWCCEQKGPVIGPRSGLIFRVKNAQVYYCNYAWFNDSDNKISCDIEEYNGIEDDIDMGCHNGGGGWMNFRGKDGSHYSVGRDPAYDGHGNEIQECGF